MSTRSQCEAPAGPPLSPPRGRQDLGTDGRSLSCGSDGDTDSVSTMVVHDVEEIAGTQTPYGGGTMVVQRVSGPPFFPAPALPRPQPGTGSLPSVPADS